MSLFVNDPRSRGRSKSPGRRDERSRSRDIRAPSPAAKPKQSYRESLHKSSRKNYDDDSDSEADPRSKKKSSKKYYSDEDSDEIRRSKKSAKKYYDDDDRDEFRKPKKPSKKYYEDDVEESESSSDSDDRHRTHERSKPKYEVAEPKHRRAASPDTHSGAVARKADYKQSSHPQYERDHREERHPSYASPDRHEHAKPGGGMRPTGYTRHLSSSSNEGHGHAQPGYAVPGQYKWEHDYPSEVHDRGTGGTPYSGPNQAPYLPMGGNTNVNHGNPHMPQQQFVPPVSNQYPNQPISPQYDQPPYGYSQPHPISQLENQRVHSGSLSSATGGYQYADLSQQVAYAPKNDSRKPSYTQSAQPQFVEAKPHKVSLHTQEITPKLHRLSVSGGTSGGLSVGGPGQRRPSMSGGLPPGSPLLEAYHGTYQSISPMPSPMMLPSTMNDELSDLEQLSPQYSSDDSRTIHPKKSSFKKRVSFYDPEPDALALAAALKHSKPDSGPIISVLPRLSHDHILELRTEYKKHIKTNGKGINIAKHIKLKVPGNLGKIAYAVALGRWESEAHWANFWYQANTSRRELLIESLMGRTNSEIVKIKDAFSDKRYNDSLEKCMQTELKKDKFRNAVLLALEEKRMDENEKLSLDLVRRDCQNLYKALTSKEGGETAMIDIIVVRSDNHLREVLRVFEGNYHKNFAREMIQKSRNLVVRILFLLLSQGFRYSKTTYIGRDLSTHPQRRP